MGILEWLDSTPVPALVLETAWGFPIVEVIHIFGMTLIIGGLVLINLRLFGINPGRIPVQALTAHILPWLGVGFVISLLSGLTFFASDAGRYWGNTAFRIKLVLLTLALINFAVFYYRIYRKGRGDDSSVSTRTSAVISLLLLVGILAAGRLIPYLDRMEFLSQ